MMGREIFWNEMAIPSQEACLTIPQKSTKGCAIIIMSKIAAEYMLPSIVPNNVPTFILKSDRSEHHALGGT